MLSDLRSCLGCSLPMTENGMPRIEGVRKFQAKGMCTLCYQVALKVGDISARPRPTVCSGNILCINCNRLQPESCYKSQQSTKSGKNHECRFCMKLRKRYTLTYHSYMSILIDQDFRCKICRCELDMESPREIHVDHDHSCCPRKSCGTCVRGVLCRSCNLGLGNFKDNPELLKVASTYLETYNAGR